MKKRSNWVPEIYYEESEGNGSQIPFIMVPQNEIMPQVLHIFESKATERVDIDDQGNPLPIYEWDLYQYGNMNTLKNELDPDIYDKVRLALGLEELAIAAEKGKKKTEIIKDNIKSS